MDRTDPAQAADRRPDRAEANRAEPRRVSAHRGNSEVPVKAKDRVEAVDRALTILEVFASGRESFSLAELAEATGFYKSTILRLCGSLEAFGYLVRRETGRYHLGAAAWQLAGHYQRNYRLDDHVRPVLRDLSEATGETASFYVREGAWRICLFRHNTSRMVRHHLEEGIRLPLDRGAAGRIFLAMDGDADPRSDLARRQGYYISEGERDPDLFAIAVPVGGRGEQIRGVLAVSGLLTRNPSDTRPALVALLRQAADRIAAGLPDN